MRLFARVLCLEGYDDLASDAAAALDRLIAILGDPGEEEVEEEAGGEPPGEKGTVQAGEKASGNLEESGCVV